MVMVSLVMGIWMRRVSGKTLMLELLYKIWYYLRELVHVQEETEQIDFHYQFAATFENAQE